MKIPEFKYFFLIIDNRLKLFLFLWLIVGYIVLINIQSLITEIITPILLTITLTMASLLYQSICLQERLNNFILLMALTYIMPTQSVMHRIRFMVFHILACSTFGI